MSVEGARGLLRRVAEAIPGTGAAPGAGDHGLLAALLRIPAAEAAAVRARTPGRPRPHPQRGPSADYGRS
jgi:hypothetical protein